MPRVQKTFCFPVYYRKTQTNLNELLDNITEAMLIIVKKNVTILDRRQRNKERKSVKMLQQWDLLIVLFSIILMLA